MTAKAYYPKGAGTPSGAFTTEAHDLPAEHQFFEQLTNRHHSLANFPAGPLVRLLYRSRQVSYQLSSGAMRTGMFRAY